ncbi:hypothetical protein Bca52824_035905 [Brassica carinata]|uniref:Uncharacterized protein n=1 Tax=Brassica carinata TaxID=52824 RepID=A0A8X7S546_BRACI|nr:hypothetical protein Bca52824_035905 [Brassica carinata]
MSKMIPLNLKIILYMLYSQLFLCIYFAFHSSSSSPEPNPNLPLRFHVSVNNHSATPKPWPILPSYLPGRRRRRISRSLLRRLLRERIHPERGEKLEEVMGRNEEAEFQEGAFEVAEDEMLNEYVQEGGIDTHTMRDLVASIRIVGTEDFVCEEIRVCQYVPYRDRLVQRLSVSSRVTGLPNRPHVVFIDGHCTVCSSSCSYSVSFTQNHQETWTALFSGIRYAKNFSKPVCFRHAVLSPLGYETALVKGFLWQNPNVKKTARLSEFGEMIRSAFGFTVNRHRSSETSSSSSPLHNVLFVRREDYLAHPRHDGKVQPLLINEEEVFESLHHWVASGSTDQVRAIQDASVIIGAHGAGLTHIVSATPNTTIFEIVSVEFQTKWKGLEYHVMHLANSRADPTAVIEKLKEIMKSLGC